MIMQQPKPKHTFVPSQIACVRFPKDHRRVMTVYRVIALDEGHTVVREIAYVWPLDDEQGVKFKASKGIAKDYHGLIPLELLTSTELHALRAVRTDVPEDAPTVESQ